MACYSQKKPGISGYLNENFEETIPYFLDPEESEMEVPARNPRSHSKKPSEKKKIATIKVRLQREG